MNCPVCDATRCNKCSQEQKINIASGEDVIIGETVDHEEHRVMQFIMGYEAAYSDAIEGLNLA